MSGLRFTEEHLAQLEREGRVRVLSRQHPDLAPPKLHVAGGGTVAGGSPTPGGEGVEKHSPHQSKRGHPEDDLQRAVAELLDWALPADHRWMHVPNGGRRDAREAARLKGMGVKPGAADVLILRPAPKSFVWIELKAPKGVLSDVQKDWRDWCLSIGAPWALCRSVDEVVAACVDADVKLRVRA